MKLTKVTITGIDDTVDVDELNNLVKQYRFVELGVLCSSSREGKDPRYPGKKYVASLIEGIAYPWHIAAHLCGQFSRDAITGGFIWGIDRHDLFVASSRIQFNGADAKDAVNRLAEYSKFFPGKQFILQTADFCPSGTTSHACGDYLPAFLLDKSGGRGLELDECPMPPSRGDYGYAGGLGPDNLRSVLEKITAMRSEQGFWVDMESKIRTNDRLDLDKVRQCLEIAKSFI